MAMQDVQSGPPEVPIDLDIRLGSDTGTPLVVSHPDSPQARTFEAMARALHVAVSDRS